MTALRVLLAAILTSSCTLQVFGSDDQINLKGNVMANGMPVAGATITVVTSTSSSTGTNSDGRFTMKLSPDNDRVKLNVEKAGFAPTIAVVTRKAGVFQYDVQIELTAPTRMTMPMTDDAGMQQMMVSAGGQDITIEVPPGVLPPGATLEVTAFEAQNGPGTMETTEGVDQLLQTGGMLHIRVVDMAGKEVKTLGGQGISITPGVMTDIGEVGMTQAYGLNDDAVWAPSTTTGGSKAGKSLSAQKEGFWNCDRRFRTSCVRGRLNAPNKACGGQKVFAGGAGGSSLKNFSGLYSQDTSGANGEFCLEGPQGMSRTLRVGRTDQVFPFPQAPGSCRTNPGACEDIGELTVSDDDCPGSCGKNEVDTASGCKAAPSGAGGGGGGTGGSGGGSGPYNCSTTQQCSAWNNRPMGCQWRSCACVDQGAMCGRSWYETSAGGTFPCGTSCTSDCTSAVQAMLAACK